MAAPSSKQSELGKQQAPILYPYVFSMVTPKIWNDRVVVDLRDFIIYKENGKAYPMKDGLFLYPSQFRGMVQLINESHSAGETPYTQPLADSDGVTHDLRYGARVTCSFTVLGYEFNIEIPTKTEEKRFYKISGNEFADIRGNIEAIEADVDAMKFWLKQKEEAQLEKPSTKAEPEEKPAKRQKKNKKAE